MGVALSLVSPQGQYRTALYDQWVKQLTIHQVPHTMEPTLIGTLGNPVKIRSWQVPTSKAGVTKLHLQCGLVHTSCIPSSHPPSWARAQRHFARSLPGPARGWWVEGRKMHYAWHRC